MSPLHDALTQYVAVRRSLGTQFREPALTLRHFVAFLERQGAEFITTQLALEWACQPQGVQRATWARRLSQVRGFAAWLSASDARTVVPPRQLLNVRHRRNKPYIFTEKEIARLMTEAARLPSASGLRALTYETLIGLLAATGLRPGEAVALDGSDVDLQNGVLAVRQSKFGKSRFVPLAQSTREALMSYAQQRDQLCPRCQTNAFLVSERGTRLKSCASRRTFASVSCSIGLRKAVKGPCIGRGPRLQDLRHTFVTRRLVEWYRAGLDVQQQLPKLATYLGHVSVASTYWYIEAVPELLQLATEQRRVKQAGGVP